MSDSYEDAVDYGDKMFHLRLETKARNLSDVAEAMGVTFLYLSEVEAGLRDCSEDELRRYLDVIGRPDKADELAALLHKQRLSRPYELTPDLLIECVEAMSQDQRRRLARLLGVPTSATVQFDRDPYDE